MTPAGRPRRAHRRVARVSRFTARSQAAASAYRYELGEAQHIVFSSRARFRVLVAGRRFGKTVLACIELLLFALTHGGARCWYVAPTKEMAEEIAWDTLKDLLRMLPARLVASISETKLRIRFRNGSTIQLKSAHKRDALRGRPLDLLVIDECAMLPKELWDEVLAPMLADRQGRALFITTPRGFNWVYDFYLGGLTGKGPAPANAATETDEDIAAALGVSVESLKESELQGLEALGVSAGSLSPEALDALKADAPDEWAAWQFSTLDGGRVKLSEVRRLRSRLDPRAFRQELLASFEAMGGRVYDGFSRLFVPTGNLDDAIVDRGGELFVGFDFNVNPMTAVIAQRGVTPEHCEVLACITLETSNTRELGAAVIQRFGGVNAAGQPVRRLVAHPDPAGKARDTRSGTTDHNILAELGFLIDASPAHPAVTDRVNVVQSMLCAADGTRRLTLHPHHCTPLIRALEGQVWDEKGARKPDKGKGLDHPNDALGYLCWQSFNLLASLWKRTRVLY